MDIFKQMQCSSKIKLHCKIPKPLQVKSTEYISAELSPALKHPVTMYITYKIYFTTSHVAPPNELNHTFKMPLVAIKDNIQIYV